MAKKAATEQPKIKPPPVEEPSVEEPPVEETSQQLKARVAKLQSEYDLIADELAKTAVDRTKRESELRRNMPQLIADQLASEFPGFDEALEAKGRISRDLIQAKRELANIA